MVGVNRGDMVGEVGFGAGLYDKKNTAFVKAPETLCRWIDDGVRADDDHLGTRYLSAQSRDSYIPTAGE